MNKTIKGQNKKPSIWSWIHRNRIKITAFMFIVIIPFSFLLTVYLGAYTNNNKVHFDTEVTDETVYVKSFVKPDELEALSLTVNWTELKNPIATTNPVGWIGGYYKFSIFYTANENYAINSVRVTPVLQTQWIEMRSSIGHQTVATVARSIQLDFNYDLPANPLWFVNVTDPILYLKVEYTYDTPSGEVLNTEYVSIDLSTLNPERVIPNT